MTLQLFWDCRGFFKHGEADSRTFVGFVGSNRRYLLTEKLPVCPKACLLAFGRFASHFALVQTRTDHSAYWAAWICDKWPMWRG